jgi:hypothetical protein
MRLIFDEWNGVWVWVSEMDENVELSPQFDEEFYAVQWQQRMKRIFTGK